MGGQAGTIRSTSFLWVWLVLGNWSLTPPTCQAGEFLALDGQTGAVKFYEFGGSRSARPCCMSLH
jgi:hypothetical protein